MKRNISLALTFSALFLMSSVDGMRVGTNFFYLADWVEEKPFVAGSSLPVNPWVSGFNVWNPQFLEDNKMFEVFRPMHWNATNPLRDTNGPIRMWSQRMDPESRDNFVGNAVGTGEGPGLAYEWQIDLCNRAGADYWVTLPAQADDNYMRQLARLIRQYLDPDLRVYVELANEFWNYQREQQYALEKGIELGLQRPDQPGDTFGTAMRWQAYRSAEMWAIFEEEWGEESDRVINVLAGWSTNAWMTEHLHLTPLFHEAGFNPTGALPEAYAIAPYFGGNGLPGSDPNVWELLRTDLFTHRWNNSGTSSRLKNVQDQHAVVVGKFGLELVAYEGGQHIIVDALAPNHHPEMYNIYLEYFDAMKPYFTLFVHYSSTSNNGDNGSFGLRDYTGQPASEAPKLRALQEWVLANPPDSRPGEPTGPAPVAELTATPVVGTAPLAVLLDASASSDPEGRSLTFEWDIDDGNGFVPGEATRVALFMEGGTYEVWVRVTNEHRSAVRAATIDVAESGSSTAEYRLEILHGVTGAWGAIAEIDWLVGEEAYPAPRLTGSSPDLNATGLNGWHAYDGSTSSIWDLQGESGTSTLTITTAGGQEFDNLRIRVNEARRGPGSLIVSVSNDGSNWIELGSFSVLTEGDWEGLERTFPLSYPDTAPEIVTAATIQGTVGRAYAFAFSSMSGNGLIEWSITSGSLPDGLILDSAGIVMGTPTTAGESTFTVQAMDADGDTNTREFTIEIQTPPPVKIVMADLPNGHVGTTYSIAFSAAGGDAVRNWVVDGGRLPPGLNLFAAGILSGTPLEAGEYVFTVKVSDGQGSADSASMTIWVEEDSPEPVFGELSEEPKYTEHGWIWDWLYPYVYYYEGPGFVFIAQESISESIFLYVFEGQSHWSWTGEGVGRWHFNYGGPFDGWQYW